MQAQEPQVAAGEGGLLEAGIALAQGWVRLLLLPLIASALAFGIASVLPKSYMAKTLLLPPQQSQGGAAAALANLGALASLAGAGAVRTPSDQFAALMQSNTVADRIIDRFKLLEVYDVAYRFDARRILANRVDITIGKKDGLISIEVTDGDPKRAADIANAHVEELRRMASQLAVGEAAQRRAFFEKQMLATRDRLAAAQQALQSSGFSAGALRAEPRTAAEGYARLRAEATAAEVRLQSLRSSFAESAPEVQQLASTLAALRAQLSKSEARVDNAGDTDYVGKYREFKYQETLFELFSRQYEIARVDESREGGLIQVIDVALPAEKQSGPRRVRIAAGAYALMLVLTSLWLLGRHSWLRTAADPAQAGRLAELRAAFRWR